MHLAGRTPGVRTDELQHPSVCLGQGREAGQADHDRRVSQACWLLSPPRRHRRIRRSACGVQVRQGLSPVPVEQANPQGTGHRDGEVEVFPVAGMSTCRITTGCSGRRSAAAEPWR